MGKITPDHFCHHNSGTTTDKRVLPAQIQDGIPNTGNAYVINSPLLTSRYLVYNATH